MSAISTRVLSAFLVVVIGCAMTTGAGAQLACGDCNADMIVSIVDALTAAQHSVGLITVADPTFAYCNVSGTPGLMVTPGTTVDIVDALEIAQAAAGLGVLACGDPCFGAPPSASGVAAASPGSGLVLVNYTLTDPGNDVLDVVVEFDTGSGFAAATMGFGGDGITALAATSGGTAHVFAWDSGLDLPGDSGTVTIRITPDDGCPTTSGVAAISASFAVCNGTLPMLTFTSTPPGGAAATTITFDVDVIDFESDSTDVLFEYQVMGGGFMPASAASGSNPVVGATASPAGTPLSFDWDAQSDLSGLATMGVEMRATPMDVCARPGASVVQGPFDLIAAGTPITLPRTLMDSAAFVWDLIGTHACGTPATVAISNGTSDAYDGGLVLKVGTAYFPSTSMAILDLGGRQISVGPAVMSGLEVTRKFYVPTTATYCRVLEIFHNPTGAPINVNVIIETNPGSDSSTTIFGSSSGDLIFGTNDDWLCTDDSSPTAGDPSLIHVIGGSASATQPSSTGSVVFSCAATNGVTWTFPITVPAGQDVTIMHFGSQNPNQTVALAAAPNFINLTITDALTGISAARQATIINF